MKSMMKLGLAAALFAGSVGGVFAQDAAAGVAGAAKAGTEAAAGVAADPTTTASIGDTASLMSSLNATATVDLAALTEASTVNFVTVSSLTDADPAAIDAAVQSKADAMTSLHASIDANAALKAKLEAAGYSTDDVLAIQGGADGSFTIYIDDRA